MGMFDEVNYQTTCPDCKIAVKDFQTKDGPCIMKTLEPREVRSFYSTCDQCKRWIDVEVIVDTYHLQEFWVKKDNG